MRTLAFFTSLPTIPFKYSKNLSFKSGLHSAYSTVASRYPVDFTKTVNFIQKTGDLTVKGAGNSKATKHTNTQAEAYAYAWAISINQKSELIVHGKNGQIRERNSYGNDPYPPKG